ncbi:MAG: tetratricopeptide repeat protein [Rikenellaceae bacterium]|nr:tetratricopeptide repeat protein [Rikenellaceae bacterium]
MVKKIFILITALAATLLAVAQEDSVATATAAPALGNEQIWDEANTAYVNANYPRAIELYHSIEDQGLASAKLYYNMGNAYFKTDDMGHAILYYNKALRLSPGDQDIRYNLDVANSYTKDRIQVVPELFLTRWIRSVRQTISGNAWAVLSLVFFAVMLVAVMAYMLVHSLLFRKIGFFATIVSLLLFVITTSFAVTERRHATSPTEAIVMRASVSVKAAPEKNSTDMFVLHEGTKVRVGNSVEGWIEVTIADGNKGWLEERTIEMID